MVKPCIITAKIASDIEIQCGVSRPDIKRLQETTDYYLLQYMVEYECKTVL